MKIKIAFANPLHLEDKKIFKPFQKGRDLEAEPADFNQLLNLIRLSGYTSAEIILPNQFPHEKDDRPVLRINNDWG